MSPIALSECLYSNPWFLFSSASKRHFKLMTTQTHQEKKNQLCQALWLSI